MTAAGRRRRLHLSVSSSDFGAWAIRLAELAIGFSVLVGGVRAGVRDSAGVEDVRVFFGDVVAACTTSDQEQCLELVEEILGRPGIEGKRVSSGNTIYNAEALTMNVAAGIYLDLGRFDEAEAILRDLVSRYGDEGMFDPLWGGKDVCWFRAGPAALQRLYSLYSGKPGKESTNQQAALETAHELIRRFPDSRISCNGWEAFIDCEIAKKMLAPLKSEGKESFVREAERILSESEGPSCQIGVRDALARMRLGERDYVGAIELYKPIVERYSDYVIEPQPFHGDYYRFSSPSYASLLALEEIGMIYLFRIKNREKASETFARAARFCDEIALKDERTPASHKIEQKAEKYRAVAEGRFVPERPIVESKQVGHFAWHPDGKTIAYSVRGGGIYEKQIDEEGDGDLIIEQAGGLVHYTSGGQLIHTTQGDIWAYGRLNGAQRRLTFTYERGKGGKMFQARVSPGDSLAIFNRIGKLHLLDLRTGEIRPLSHCVFEPRWSADGKSVIGQYRGEKVQLDVATGEVKEYTPSGPIPMSFSPDGRYSVCRNKRRRGLVIVSKDGTVTELPQWYRYPGESARWSPDGEYIAYVVENDKILLAVVPEEFR